MAMLSYLPVGVADSVGRPAVLLKICGVRNRLSAIAIREHEKRIDTHLGLLWHGLLLVRHDLEKRLMLIDQLEQTQPGKDPQSVRQS